MDVSVCSRSAAEPTPAPIASMKPMSMMTGRFGRTGFPGSLAGSISVKPFSHLLLFETLCHPRLQHLFHQVVVFRLHLVSLIISALNVSSTLGEASILR